MGKKRKAEAHGGGHGWYVTFADLMGLLMAFFVMIAAFSTMNQEKMKQALGSIREAFGVQTDKVVNGGVMEINGLPVRSFPKHVAMTNPVDSTQQPGPIIKEFDRGRLKAGSDQQFSTAATTLRQALQDMPEIAEISQNILIEQTNEGLEIQLMDQDGRSMFPEGSKEPYDRVRAALVRLTPVLRALPQRISITGHTAESQAVPGPGYGPWEISADRANSVRRILAENGLQMDRFSAITGKADTQPLYPDNPFLPANRRVTITLMSEAPPVPSELAP
ncbi:membrane protein [Terrihabitans soli]|uniref:Membrane protein n=1 Tax=Terrihabitans soli TaxID=708113 RepID=A0A6S6QKL8_9HYPH|nr:flagellar motor protein MotB [Terrihabitans soli]BCJ89816.1 membrane protein [Terrihabitans soli]